MSYYEDFLNRKVIVELTCIMDFEKFLDFLKLKKIKYLCTTSQTDKGIISLGKGYLVGRGTIFIIYDKSAGFSFLLERKQVFTKTISVKSLIKSGQNMKPIEFKQKFRFIDI